MNILTFLFLVVLSTTAFTIADDDLEDASNDCGRHSFSVDDEVRITDGREAREGEFPWLAVINYEHKPSNLFVGIKCSGFVINRNYVLTAAHCLHFVPYKIHSVWLGVRKISEANTIDYRKVQKFRVKRSVVHDNYDPINRINDIALLKLDGPIRYTRYVNRICLPRYDERLPENGTMLTVAGWGQPSPKPEGEHSDPKLIVKVPIYSYEECTKRLGYLIRNDQLCAEAEYMKGTCRGDAGGPLMEYTRGSHSRAWYATGIITEDSRCGWNKPIVHTRISSYIRWIADVISRP